MPRLRAFDRAIGWSSRRVRGHLADPEGNRWEITWAPGIALNQAGAH
jgi:hypothetical protein